MTQQEAKNYIEGAFQALKDRGWFLKTGLVPTGVTDREIAEFEAESELKLPTLLKAFLKWFIWSNRAVKIQKFRKRKRINDKFDIASG